MCKVQFLKVKVDDVNFDDPMLNILWKSQKELIYKQIEGLLSKADNDNEVWDLGIYDPYAPPTQGPTQGPTQQEQEQEQEKEKEQGKVKGKGDARGKTIKKTAFNFQLNQKSNFNNLSITYKQELKNEIDNIVKNNPNFLTYDEFKSICLNDEFDNFQRAYLKKSKEKLESQIKARFDVLWAEYPNKSDYKEALEAFKKLEPKLPSIDEMVQSIREYNATNQENANLPTLKNWLVKSGIFDTSENQPQELPNEQTKTAKDIIKSLSDEFEYEFLNELPF